MKNIFTLTQSLEQLTVISIYIKFITAAVPVCASKVDETLPFGGFKNY